MILYIIMDIICLQGIGGRERVVFIQIAKCADRRARTNGACGIRLSVLFEILSVLCLFSCFGVAPASNSRESAQLDPLTGLRCVRITPARRSNDVGLTIVLINADMQFPRLI